MLKTLTTLVATASLAGCVTLGGALSPTHAAQLRSACNTADALYPTFKTLVDGGVLKGSAARNGQSVYDVAKLICATPSDATYGDVLAVIAQAAVLAKILKDADQ
jgi:hypothetical protein